MATTEFETMQFSCAESLEDLCYTIRGRHVTDMPTISHRAATTQLQRYLRWQRDVAPRREYGKLSQESYPIKRRILEALADISMNARRISDIYRPDIHISNAILYREIAGKSWKRNIAKMPMQEQAESDRQGHAGDRPERQANIGLNIESRGKPDLNEPLVRRHYSGSHFPHKHETGREDDDTHVDVASSLSSSSSELATPENEPSFREDEVLFGLIVDRIDSLFGLAHNLRSQPIDIPLMQQRAEELVQHAATSTIPPPQEGQIVIANIRYEGFILHWLESANLFKVKVRPSSEAVRQPMSDLRLRQILEGQHPDETTQLSKLKPGIARERILKELHRNRTYGAKRSGYTWRVFLIETLTKPETAFSQAKRHRAHTDIDVVLALLPDETSSDSYSALQGKDQPVPASEVRNPSKQISKQIVLPTAEDGGGARNQDPGKQMQKPLLYEDKAHQHLEDDFAKALDLEDDEDKYTHRLRSRSYGGQGIGGPDSHPTPMNQFADPTNTTVFVGGLSANVTEDELRSFFQGFGEIVYVKIPLGKYCGFVKFVHRYPAEMAINQMQGYPIGNSRVRLDWGGRTPK